MEESLDVHWMCSIANQRAFAAADVAKIEEVARSGGSSAQAESGEFIEPDVIVENDHED